MLRLMRDQHHTMHKACKLAGIKQQTVFARFKKHPVLHEVVAGRAAIPDEEQHGEDEEEDRIEQMDMGEFGRGRGRPNDIPADVEDAIARKIETAIMRLNAPTTYAILKKLVQRVCFFQK